MPPKYGRKGGMTPESLHFYIYKPQMNYYIRLFPQIFLKQVIWIDNNINIFKEKTTIKLSTTETKKDGPDYNSSTPGYYIYQNYQRRNTLLQSGRKRKVLRIS